MTDRLLAIQQSDMTHAARSLYTVYVTQADDDGVARGPNGTPLTQKQAAEMIGSSSPRVSSLFGALVDAGWIEKTPMGPKPTTPDNTRSESTSYQTDNYQSDNPSYQSDNRGYQSDNSADPSPSSSSLPPKNIYSNPPLSFSTLSLNGSVPEIEISDPLSGSQRVVDRWLLPPASMPRAEPLPGDHPAVSERHLRYRMAAKWSLRLLEEAEDKIESFRIPSSVRRKAKRDRSGLLEDWSDTFRLLQEQDEMEWDDVRYAIHWLFTQSDWLRNGYIASIKTLRRKTKTGDRTKFEAILTQAKADDSYDGPESGGSVGGGGNDAGSNRQRIDDELDAAARREREGQPTSGMEYAGVG